MRWIKKGHIYAPDGRSWWAKQYAFPPTPLLLDNGILRIYVGFCDERMVGRLGYVDVAADRPATVLGVSAEPLLDVGAPGAFDDNGLLPTAIVDVDGVLYLYYVGYQLGTRVRYYQFEGLAVSRDGGNTFERRLRVPVTDRSDAELLHRTSAFVRRAGGRFEMWYTAGSEWIDVGGKALPKYDIRYLASPDGIQWGAEGRVCVTYANADEHAFGKPCVFEHGGVTRMIYSVRTKSKGYRLGYAESRDGVTWERKDDAVGIDVSESGWDSEMLCYATLMRYQDKVYLFYNGNNLGATGFGYAELAEW